MARLASQRGAALVGSSATMTMVWLTLLLSLLMWLPSGMVRLVDTHGEVLLVDVVVQDATLGTRFLRHLPAWTHAPSPSVALHGLIPWLGCVTLFLLLLARASRGVQLERACWRVTQFLGLGLVVIGLIDGVQLFIGEVDLPSASALQMSMARLAGNDLSAEVVGTLDGGRLGLASRPLLDLLRVLLGGVFFVMGVSALREATPASARVGAEPLFPVAVGLLITSAFLMPGQTVRLGLTAAVILWAASWVTGHLMGPRARTPHDLMWGAVVVTCFTWLAPVAGWLDPGLGR